MKELVQEGHIYIGTPPLYLVKKGQMSEYVYDDKALPAAVKRMGKGYANIMGIIIAAGCFAGGLRAQA